MSQKEEVQDVTVEETTVEETTVETTKVEEPPKEDKSFVKIREEKAQKQLLKQLGVASVEEALDKMNSGKEALTKINELEAKLQKAERERILDLKTRQLTAVLESEKVFDSEALLHYVELDNVELDEHGKIKESDKIVAQLKSIKPNYFGVEQIKSDAYVQGGKTEPKSEYEELYKSGNYVGALSKYLKSQK